MMNLVFISSSMKGLNTESVVSEERLREIYDVPETAQLWEKVVSHENYDNLYLRAARFFSFFYGQELCKLRESGEKAIKRELIRVAMYRCAQKGGTFDAAMQEVIEEFFQALARKTAEEIDAVSTATENHINLMSSMFTMPEE